MYAQEASNGWADIYLQHPALVGLVTPVLMSESKCQKRLVAVCYPHRWTFFILCVPHAALHLGNSGEKLNVPVLWREQDYADGSCVITWAFWLGHFSMRKIPHHMGLLPSSR